MPGFRSTDAPWPLYLALCLAPHATAAAVPPSVERLLTPEPAAPSGKAELTDSGGAGADQPLIYLVRSPDGSSQTASSQQSVTELLEADRIQAAARQQDMEPRHWLEATYPDALHMGIIRPGREEPLEENVITTANEDALPLRLPEIEWLNLRRFWNPTGYSGAGARIGILDSGFKSIVPPGFRAGDDDNFTTKYRIHPAFTDGSDYPSQPLVYRPESPELNNRYYGAPRRDPDSVAKQYQIKGLRSAHGTQMSCALAGGDWSNDGRYRPRGAAPDATLVFDFAGDETVQIDPLTGDYVDRATAIRTTLNSLAWISHQDIHLINYSFGHGKHYAQAWADLEYDPSAVLVPYSAIARAFDRAAYHLDFLLFKSAGNRSLANDPYGFTLSEPADTYNGIAVGNMNPYYEEGEPDNMRERKPRERHHLRLASGRGPSLDGRRKPDIVAPGSHVMSCTVPFIDDEREDYQPRVEARTVSGTSIAAPLAGGVAALIGEALRSDDASSWNLSGMPTRYSLATKAVLINSAENRSPTAYESARHIGALGREPSIFEDRNNRQWNNGYGFGYIDAGVAAEDYRNLLQDSIAPGETRYYRLRAQGTQPPGADTTLKVTMAWEKRFPLQTSHRDYDYGHPLTPMTMTLFRAGTAVASDDSAIDPSMTRHRINRKVVDYAVHPVENDDYTAYNNVLQLQDANIPHHADSCVAISVMTTDMQAIAGQPREAYVLAANYPLQPVDSCAIESS